MPQVLALVIAGAGLYAGLKWMSRVLAQTAAARQAEAEARKQARGGGPKDLGTLEYDPQAGVYRPRGE